MNEHFRIVFDCPKYKSARIIIPAPKALKTMTIEEIAKRTVPESCTYRIIYKDMLPKSREFRNAWTDKFDTDTVDVDMEKARPIHMDRIRKLRDKKLKDLDLEFMKAVEIDDKAKIKAVSEQKQILRDIPQVFDLEAYKTPEELSEALPKELK